MLILPSGGMHMNAGNFWELFLDTGAPEAYLLYLARKKSEEIYVPDHSGHCPESCGVQ